MSIYTIEQILSKIEAASNFYDELMDSDIRTEHELETVKLKMRYSKEELIKLTLKLKEECEQLSREIEKGM